MPVHCTGAEKVMMKFEALAIPDVIKITPIRYCDSRGYFSEIYKDRWFRDTIADCGFVQENQSLSLTAGTVRGLHFQVAPFDQGKLVHCLAGAIFDVAVDIRVGSSTFGKWVAAELTADNGDQLPFNSENQVNISPFFERDRWSARVTYSWRSKYYTQVDRGNYLVTDDYDSLDANLSFRINDRLSLGIDGMNLLDSEYYTYAEVPGIANTEKLVRGSYRTGRRYMASLRFQF